MNVICEPVIVIFSTRARCVFYSRAFYRVAANETAVLPGTLELTSKTSARDLRDIRA